ncbi:Hydrogen peroxide-inducible protein activator [compost metagenome]
MHIAQPALSRQISALETTLGVPLVTRMPRGVTLTRPGEELRLRALDILHRTSAIGDQVRVASSGMAGTLRIGVMPGYSAIPQLTAAIRKLQEASPAVSVRIEAMHSAEQLERLHRHHLDVGIVAWRSPFDAAFTGVPIFDDRMALALPAHWPQASQRKRLRLHDLASLPLLMFPRERSPVHYDRVVQACAAAGIAQGHSQVSVMDTLTMVGMVAAGLGYAIAPLSFQQQWKSQVVFAPATDLNIPFTLELVRYSRRQDPLVEHFFRQWEPAP